MFYLFIYLFGYLRQPNWKHQLWVAHKLWELHDSEGYALGQWYLKHIESIFQLSERVILGWTSIPLPSTAEMTEVTFLLHALHVHQLLHIVWVVEPQLHAHKWLPALQAQFVPGLWASKEIWDWALCEPQDRFPKQTLTCKRNANIKLSMLKGEKNTKYKRNKTFIDLDANEGKTIYLKIKRCSIVWAFFLTRRIQSLRTSKQLIGRWLILLATRVLPDICTEEEDWSQPVFKCFSCQRPGIWHTQGG